MVQSPAPAWSGDAVVNGKFESLSSAQYKGKWLVFFFYPLVRAAIACASPATHVWSLNIEWNGMEWQDFTFVCPTEIIAFSERAAEFRAIGAEVVGVSVDSKFSHLAWINTPRKNGGLGEMKIPLVADITKDISRDYGVLLPGGIALRGLFIVDPQGVLRISQVNDLPIGRSVDETLRLVWPPSPSPPSLSPSR
jgi:alkyl hydroperoxide reductase subunit AhpC